MTNDELLTLIDQAAREGWTELDLRDQEISELPPEIGLLTGLQKLSIGCKNDKRDVSANVLARRNPLKALPLEITRLTQLRELDLGWNRLTVVPPGIVQLTSLTSLGLGGNQLTAVPPEIGQLTALKVLKLSYNQLTVVPPGIVQLTSLTELDLGGNQLKAVPPGIVQLTSLTELDLSYNRLTAVPPEIAQLANLQRLNLDKNQLTVVPPAIGQLTSLTELNLGDNQLTAVPPEIVQLTSLTSLDLSRNQLMAVPPEIVQLTSLTSLDLSENQLTAVPPEIGQLTGLTELDLRGNQLTAVPPEIGQLTGLKVLKLSYNQLTAVPPEISQLTGLTELYLWNNQLTAVPPEISQLTSLKALNLGSNQLTAVPPEIGQLTDLTGLDLGWNQLTAVPPEIGQLTSLTSLDLSRNQLTAVPPEIGQLTSLTSLDLSRNQLTAVPPEIGQLTGLTELYLGSNRLTAVPPEIGQLTSLTSLDLSYNRLTAVPPEIGQLTSLTSLDLGSNQLTAVPPEIGQLTSLTSLDLSENQLTAVPPEIGQLTSLTSLDLSENQLTAVPPEIGQLTNLTELNLRQNQLAILPPTLRRLTKLKELYLYGNPLPLPPELLGGMFNPGDPQTILNAYFQASRPLREAKLLLVGEGRVGKSSLVERLLHNRPPSDKGKTVGVDIHRWEVSAGAEEQRSRGAGSQGSTERSRSGNGGAGEIAGVDNVTRHSQTRHSHALRVNVWDFGGQEIHHATHQFFLTHRSLYLIVLESRKDESANPLDYWLRHVQSFAGDAPVIVVANKSEQHQMILDERGLQLKYPAIKAIVHTSCVTGAGIEPLRQAIEEALASLPHVNDWIPLTWFAVKEKLAALDQDTLPYDNYVALCETEGITHEADQRTLAHLLHDLGAALNFQDDRRLAGTHVLNPEWVTGGIYQILNADVLQGRGVLDLDDLDRILDRRRYPPEKHAFLLEMMQKFELCISLGDRQRYLIPDLLPKEQPPFDWPAGATPALEYRYAILPAAVLSRLIVRLHDFIWLGNNGDPIRWSNGLILARDGCRALVVADRTPAAPRLAISLEGPFPHRRHLLASIRAELNVIHNSFARLEAEEWVSIPGHPGKVIKYQTLLNAEARGKTTYYDGDSDMDLDVRQLLDGIESEAMRRTRQIQERLRRCHTAELNEIGIELGVSDEVLAAAVNAKQPTDLRRLIEQRDRPGEWLLRLVNKRGFTHIERQTIIQGDATMSSDTFHMSGDFRGAMVNIKNKLENVTQTINNMPHADSSEKQALQALVEQLKVELEKAPPELSSEAEAVAQTTEALVEAASAEKPNKTMIEITGEGLKKAAENVAAVMPMVLTIATQIVTAVSRLTG
jgi:internalin A